VDRARGTARIPIEVAMDAVVAGVRPSAEGTGEQVRGLPPGATGTIGGPVSPQPLADAESRRPRPQIEEAPPPR
ncbi:MAG TPA: hypothetical protein VF121_08675, partial [Thermoanaerobaculia bacterium]|nr:hypothetical protein [Thermoanaerobaculia bacterium]